MDMRSSKSNNLQGNIVEKIPLFLMKLWKIVNDPTLKHVVAWDDGGFSFHIHDPYTFCRNVLPQYFKHNNLNSLIRQLNMYGFRKITPIERSGLTRAESDHEHLEFSHPYFSRDQPESLVYIKRKMATTPKPEPPLNNAIVRINNPTKLNNTNSNNNNLSQVEQKQQVLDEMRQLRERQAMMDTRINSVLKENQQLWREIAQMRALHVKQQQIVNKLITFLLNVVQPQTRQSRLGKRQIFAIAPSNSDPFVDAGPSSFKRINLDKNSLDVLDALQNELAPQNQQTISVTPASVSSRHNSIAKIPGQMTITDVTDELCLDGSSPAPSTGRQTVQMVDSPLDATLTSTMTRSPGPQSHWRVTSPGPPTASAAPVYIFDETSSACVPPNSLSISQSNSNNQIAPLNGDTQSSPFHSELKDFLSGVDMSLDTYRDTLTSLNGGTTNFDPDDLSNLFRMCEQTPLDNAENETKDHYDEMQNLSSSQSSSTQNKQVAVYRQPIMSRFANQATNDIDDSIDSLLKSPPPTVDPAVPTNSTLVTPTIEDAPAIYKIIDSRPIQMRRSHLKKQ